MLSEDKARQEVHDVQKNPESLQRLDELERHISVPKKSNFEWYKNVPKYRFTDGNLLVLYDIHEVNGSSGWRAPDYIKERIKVGLETYGMILRSRQNKHKIW